MFASNRWRKCKKERTIKQILNRKHLYTKGYSVDYLYGETFDNMEDFFTGNGYKIIDKKTATF
jgi:hypothetical protein